MLPLAELIGESPGIVAVREKVARLLGRQSKGRRLPPLLLQGETGTGKGLLARAMHLAGARGAGPFVDVNCAAIPETLLEAEMFGFERGAFTDARQAKPGLFQAAHRGTIFLDEIGLLPEILQAKLLKVIEERAVRRLGSTRSEEVDVWILTATSEDLESATSAGRFRKELYHRLAVVTVRLPPLRERGADILRLAEHFLARVCADYDLAPKTFSEDARGALLAHRWPGNVRELANVIERVALLSEPPLVTAELLGLPGGPGAEPRDPAQPPGAVSLDEAVVGLERERLLEALRGTDWNLSRAAARLRIPRNTLRYRMERQGLKPPPPSRRREGRASASPAALPPAPEPATPLAASGVRWERRRLAVLRAVLLAPPGTGAAPDTSRALEVLVEKVRSFGGQVEELSLNGLVGVFGLEPIEDATRRAALAGIAIQKAAEHGHPADAGRLAVKVGIHVDDFLVGQASGAAAIDEDAKHRARAVLAALMERAEPNSVVVTETAGASLERRFELAPIGELESAGGRAYRLAGRERPGIGRPMAAFVGRRHELDLLRSRLASVVAGRGQVIGIVGEAGIGKSRLLDEFRQSLGGEAVTYLEGRCLSYGAAIPYLPILDILRQNCGITEADGPEAITEKVRRALHEVEMDPGQWASYLLHLLGVKDGPERLAALSPDALKARTLETLRQLSLNGSRRRPIVFAIEDHHWMDKTSEESVASLVESLPGAAILLVSTYRPGYRPPWADKSYATQVALQPLSPEEGLSIVRSVLQTDAVPERLARLILGKAEGNPFFLEELSRAVRERGGLGSAPSVPDTVQAVLSARIDRLPDESRQLLQAASVLGREVSSRLLAAIWEGSRPLDPHLAELTRLEFLHERPGGAESVYLFKHALTQEVAYASLLPARRRTLHAAAGEALERLYAGRLEDAYDRLAYHYAKTDRADKAAEYLIRFGRRAARIHAHAEAVTAFQEALVQIERLPPEEQDLRRVDVIPRLARALSFLGRFQEALDLLLRQQEGVERLQNPWVTGGYYLLLAHTYTFQGDRERVAETAHRAVEAARECGDEATMGKASYVLAMEGYWSGRPCRGLEYGRQAIELLERTGERWWLGQSHFSVAANHVLRGDFEAALEAASLAHAIGEALGDPRVQTPAGWLTGVIHAMRGDWERGVEVCRRALALSPDPLNTADATGWTGYAYLEKGDTPEAIRLLEQSVQQWSQFRLRPAHGGFLTLLGEAYLADGRVEQARALAGQGLELTRDTRYLLAVGWGQRLLGRIARAGGALPEAEAHFREALGTFVAIEARFESARTHLALAELARAREKPEAAAGHLAEAHARFEALRIPKYVERTRRLAETLGIPLPAASPARS